MLLSRKQNLSYFVSQGLDRCRLAAMLVNQAALAPFLNIDSKHLFVDQTATETHAAIGVLQLHFESMQKFLPDLLRHVIRVAGVNILVEDERPQKHAPVLPHQRHEPAPVELAASAINNVTDVSAVETLPSRDKDL